MDQSIPETFYENISETDQNVEDFLKQVNDREIGFVTYFNNQLNNAINLFDLIKIEREIKNIINDYDLVPGKVIKPFRLLAKYEQIHNQIKKLKK